MKRESCLDTEVRQNECVYLIDTEQAKLSLRVVAEMDIDGVLPCHCDSASPESLLERLRRME